VPHPSAGARHRSINTLQSIVSPVADLEAAVAEVEKAGATVTGAPHDVGGGTRIATVTDADGNTLGLIQRT
jgi:predicted enzyme related to lactoylglutathione lyase